MIARACLPQIRLGMMLKFLKCVFNVLYPDRRPDWEQREREFILAANGLKTLSVTDRGGMSIDPEELPDQIVASREQLKHLVHRSEAPTILPKAQLSRALRGSCIEIELGI